MRYYYKDALAAAWMAKHFGMKFGLENCGKIEWNCIGTLDSPWTPLEDWKDIIDPISAHEKLYIHPDSLHLLEPQDGDYAENRAGNLCSLGGGAEIEVGEEREVRRRKNGYKIIQRNGVPFHWPEVEE